jgi:hypothetical protein
MTQNGRALKEPYGVLLALCTSFGDTVWLRGRMGCLYNR